MASKRTKGEAGSGGPGEDAHRAAQELFFQAMDAPTEAEAVRLGRRALEADPLCVDAFLFVGLREVKTVGQRVELYRDAVRRGERGLGGKDGQAFEEWAGHFWLMMETRPYMRAMAGLAQALEMAGEFDEALAVQGEMLRLNPGDNQGIRDPMLATSLRVGRLDVARKLLAGYKEESSFIFAYGRVLERVISGDEAGAARALAAAREGGAAVEKYLRGTKKVPRRLPAMYSPGQESEAIIAASFLVPAYAAHPAAVEMLRKSKPRGGSRGRWVRNDDAAGTGE